MITVYARPTQEWQVLGLQEQNLGSIVGFSLDPTTGKIKSLSLKTEWQTIDIQWLNLEFNERLQAFKLHKSATIYHLPLPESRGDGSGA